MSTDPNPLSTLNDVAYWSQRYSEKPQHVDWLCQYETLRPLVLSKLRELEEARPRPAVLLLGTGLSTFPEDIYDSGYNNVTVVEPAPAAVEALERRCARAPRGGLVVLQRRAQDPWPEQLGQGGPPTQYGLALDKGVIDCLLTAPDDGIDAARAAVRHVWGALSTPGVWVSVSHSPPCDRLDLFLNTCHFHDVKVLRVRCCPLELCGSTSLPDPEQLQEYGQLVPPQGPGSEWSAPAEPFDMDTAYVYVLTK